MDAARRLYLHIGLQKTGTSYLQSIFWNSQEELRQQGLDMVPGSKRETFNLQLRVRNRYQPSFDPPEVARALDELPAALAAATGPRALTTEESLAPANRAQIRELLDACSGREVHLVLTLRDLARQIPSAWQQMIQSGSAMSYDEYLTRLRKHEGRPRSKLWTNKDVPAILRRWEEFVPAERIHLVTVPQPGGEPELLLRRFCAALDVDMASLNRDVARVNESIGRVQAEVLRRVNSNLPDDVRTRDVYGDVGKRFFAVTVLGAQRGERTLLPAEHQEWCQQVSSRYVEALKQGGYDVIGDLHDLLPDDGAFSEQAARPDEQDVADSATQALAVLLTSQMRGLRRRRRRTARGASGRGRVLRSGLQRLRRLAARVRT